MVIQITYFQDQIKQPINTYGQTKSVIEDILFDLKEPKLMNSHLRYLTLQVRTILVYWRESLNEPIYFLYK